MEVPEPWKSPGCGDLQAAETPKLQRPPGHESPQAMEVPSLGNLAISPVKC